MLTDSLNMRLNYLGGNQKQRINRAKLDSLKKALLYSYQSETLITEDGREFRCLINPDKLKNDYDNKILSIPFEDICLNKEKVGTTTEGIETTGIKSGDVFHWKETNTDWIIFLQHKEEVAYFRGEIRRCKYEVDVNGHKYKIYVRGPVETKVVWEYKKNLTWSVPNYTLLAYVTKNEETLDFFHRFTKVKIDGKPWEVTVVNSIGGDDIIELNLTETYNNFLEDEDNTIPVIPQIGEDDSAPHIEGDTFISPYSEKTYKIKGLSGGKWLIDSRVLDTEHVKIVSSNEEEFTISTGGKSCRFRIVYRKEGYDDIFFPIVVESI